VEEVGDEQEYHKIQEIFVHKEFNNSTLEYDFALLELSKPVRISSQVDIINLPLEDMINLHGNIAKVLGWGLNEKDVQSPTLKEIHMEILTPRVCENDFRLAKTKIKSITINHICALSENGNSSTCAGDSGGLILSHP